MVVTVKDKMSKRCQEMSYLSDHRIERMTMIIMPMKSALSIIVNNNVNSLLNLWGFVAYFSLDSICRICTWSVPQYMVCPSD